MSDLTAARERHVPVTVTDPDNGPFDFCEFCDYRWPCDASLFRDALDDVQAGYRTLMADSMATITAARTLADELGKALDRIINEYVLPGYEVGIGATGQAKRALAKWGASRG